MYGPTLPQVLGIRNGCLAYEVNLLAFSMFTDLESQVNAGVEKKEEQQKETLLDVIKGKFRMNQ